MDRGNGPVTVAANEYRTHLATLAVRVPVELKYLINYYKNDARLPSFNWAVRQLLETHPALARLAAEMVQSGKDAGGLDTPIPNGDISGSRPANVAGLFHSYLYCC